MTGSLPRSDGATSAEATALPPSSKAVEHTAGVLSPDGAIAVGADEKGSSNYFGLSEGLFLALVPLLGLSVVFAFERGRLSALGFGTEFVRIDPPGVVGLLVPLVVGFSILAVGLPVLLSRATWRLLRFSLSASLLGALGFALWRRDLMSALLLFVVLVVFGGVVWLVKKAANSGIGTGAQRIADAVVTGMGRVVRLVLGDSRMVSDDLDQHRTMLTRSVGKTTARFIDMAIIAGTCALAAALLGNLTTRMPTSWTRVVVPTVASAPGVTAQPAGSQYRLVVRMYGDHALVTSVPAAQVDKIGSCVAHTGVLEWVPLDELGPVKSSRPFVLRPPGSCPEAKP